jgi:tetratricopeptide (TPR) repeat protein
MRPALALVCVGGLATVTLLAIEPRPREEEPVPAAATTESGLPLPPPLPAPVAGLDPPEEPSTEPLAHGYHALGVATLASASRAPGAYDVGVDWLEQAVAADPAERRYKLDLADAYMFLGDEVAVGAAIDLYEELLDDEPDHDAVLGRLALAYLQMGNDEAAFTILARRAAGKRVDVRATALQLAATGLETRDLVRAAHELETLVDRHPAEPFARLILALLWSDTGRASDAVQIADRLIAELPGGNPLAAAARELKARIRQ